MHKKIIITEDKEKKFLNYLINERLSHWSEKTMLVKKYLDKHYLKADVDVMGNDMNLKNVKFVIIKDSRNQPTSYKITLKQLFEKTQYEFKNIADTQNERDSFLKQTIIDWYNNKI